MFNKNEIIKNTIEFSHIDLSHEFEVHLAAEAISAGFPSPASDFADNIIDLNKELIKNPSSTFLGRVKGLSMRDAGIGDKDILIIDKSLEPQNGKIAVCFIDGEFTLKRINIKKNEVYLVPANDDFKPIKVEVENNFIIWGIVTYVIKKV
jgi:DNA polymerase V